MTPVQNLITNISTYKFNPSGIQRVILDHLKGITNGTVDIVDPTNPFVFLLEASAVTAAAAMMESESNTRRLYPSLAQTPEDLYLHMSDKDYINRFSTPAKTIFSIMILRSDLLKKVINIPGTNTYKTTIAKNTEFTVGEITFSLQYPIDIKVMEHGGIEITYDTTVVSPIQTLSTNVLDYEVRTDGNLNEWIYFEFDVYQFKVNTINSTITPSSVFNQNITITDRYYYCRVFFKNNTSSSWQEMITTHTDQVYDSTKPTAVLAVLGDTLYVQIPQIYINSGLVSGNIRTDVYETKGELNILLENYPASSFSTNLKNIDTIDNTTYTASFTNIIYTAYSTKAISSGTNGLTFNELRTRVINNSTGEHSLPITNVQITSSLEDAGYDVVKNVDVVTNRVFLATKALPVPFDPKLITAASANVETFNSSLNDLVKETAFVKDNRMINATTGRVTILSNTLFVNNNSIINIVPKSDLDNIKSKDKDTIATIVNKNNFLYTPFHYVLDTTAEDFAVRPYFLDNPIINSIEFVNNNGLTGLQVNSSSYWIQKNTIGGYSIYLITKSNAEYKNIADNAVFAQLSFIPYLENTRVFLNGKLENTDRTATDERIYRFDIETNFDIDAQDNIVFSNFKMDSVDINNYSTPLKLEMTVTYSTINKMPPAWNPSAVDRVVGGFLIKGATTGVAGITQETLRVVVGNNLKTLWSRSRTNVTAAEYEKYNTSVPWYYETDIYKTDPVTKSNFSFGPDGEIVYTLLHKKGDVVLDENNNIVYKYLAGDIKVDSDNKPIILATAENTLTRQLDLMFIEGSYFFADDYSVIKYRKDLLSDLITWLTVDLSSMGDNLLEQTKLYFYPKKSLGQIDVVADGKSRTTISASQSFTVTLYVNMITYKNAALRDALKRLTIQVLDILLKNRTISSSSITTALRGVYDSGVLDFTHSGLGDNNNQSMISILNDKDSLSLKKKLVKLPDETLIVTEDVTVDFVLHQS